MTRMLSLIWNGCCEVVGDVYDCDAEFFVQQVDAA